MSQSLVLMLLGGTVLRISAFSTTYLNYVKPGFRPFLIAAGAVLVVLGVVGLIRDWRRPADTTASTATSTASTSDSVSTSAPASASDSASASAPASTSGSAAASVSASASASGPGSHAGHGGHDHSHVPQVAWLLCLPVFALFLISPPALGSYAAARVDTAPPPPAASEAVAYQPLPADRATDMTVGEFIGRAWGDKNKTLTGRQVRLTGFVVPAKKKNQWYVTRMQLACCAADAFPLKVTVRGANQPPADTWVEVTGTWIPPKSDNVPLGTVPPEISAISVDPIQAPSEPYE